MKNRIEIIINDNDYGRKAYTSFYAFDTKKVPIELRTKFGILYPGTNKTLAIFTQFIERLKGPTLHKKLSPKSFQTLINKDNGNFRKTYNSFSYGCFLMRFPEDEEEMMETIESIFDDLPEKNELKRLLSWMKENK